MPSMTKPPSSPLPQDMLGLELAHALGSPKQGAWPGAQMQQLREELEEARSEVRALQQLRHSGSKVSAQDRGVVT